MGTAAKYVFSVVGKVISAKKHVKGRPYQASVEGSNNTTVIINADNARMEFSREVIELLQSKLIDPDLAKIASPLHGDAIVKAQISASDEDGSLEADIISADKFYFTPQDTEETKQETEINGTLVSLNKETLRGTFKRTDGLKIPYRYVGDHPERFYGNFSQKVRSAFPVLHISTKT